MNTGDQFSKDEVSFFHLSVNLKLKSRKWSFVPSSFRNPDESFWKFVQSVAVTPLCFMHELSICYEPEVPIYRTDDTFNVEKVCR